MIFLSTSLLARRILYPNRTLPCKWSYQLYTCLKKSFISLCPLFESAQPLLWRSSHNSPFLFLYLYVLTDWTLLFVSDTRAQALCQFSLRFSPDLSPSKLSQAYMAAGALLAVHVICRSIWDDPGLHVCLLGVILLSSFDHFCLHSFIISLLCCINSAPRDLPSIAQEFNCSKKA